MNRKILASLTVTIVGATLLLASGSQALAAACPPAPSPVAHRGGEEHFTEDTRHAFRDASDIGVRFWENDVRFTADDVPVIMHDATVDRTTNGTGNVADLTYAQIAVLRTSDGQPVPTLAEFVNDQSFADAYAFIEIKTTPTASQWSSFVADIKSREGWGGPRPAISSFDPAVLDEVAARLPGYTRALIQSTGDADPADITPHASLLLKHHDSITSARLAKWLGGGLRVYSWADPAADPSSEWERIAGYYNVTGAPAYPARAGVSGYITATPAAYLAWRNSRVC